MPAADRRRSRARGSCRDPELARAPRSASTRSSRTTTGSRPSSWSATRRSDLIATRAARSRISSRTCRRARSLGRPSLPLRVALADQRRRAGARGQQDARARDRLSPGRLAQPLLPELQPLLLPGRHRGGDARTRARGRPRGAPPYLGRLLARLRSGNGRARDRRRLPPGAGRSRPTIRGSAPSTRRRSTRSRPSAARASSTRRARVYRDRHGRDIEQVEDLARDPTPCSASCRRSCTAGAGCSIPRAARSCRRTTTAATTSTCTTSTASASRPGRVATRSPA